MTSEGELKYLEFASNLSFYEFIQDEFRTPHFQVDKYEKEIKTIISNRPWDNRKLALFIFESPKSFDIFQEIFQLDRFTNTQLIHFLFDIKALNSPIEDERIRYLKKNISHDPYFFKIFCGVLKRSKTIPRGFRITFDTKEELLDYIDSIENKEFKKYIQYLFKITISRYISRSVGEIKNDTKDNYIVHNRISIKEFPDVASRISEFLIDNLNLNDVIKGIDLTKFLENKRKPIDTKSIHGNFGKIKLRKILEKHGFIEVDISENRNLEDKFVFYTEQTVEEIDKQFDFILSYNRPKVLIETNFYTTSGTKIGINEGEYVSLYKNIKENFSQFKFIWITDGNYWLLPDGKKRFLRLYDTFKDDVLNYNLFDLRLDQIKKGMRG